MADSHEVVIVGGGAVGAALAIELAEAGRDVALVESRPPSFAAGVPERVIALNEGSRRHLARLQAWTDALAASAGVIERIVVGEPGGPARSPAQVELSAAEARASLDEKIEALGFVVEMGALLSPLYARLKALGVRLIAPAHLEALETGDAAARLRLRSGEDTRMLEARLVVGADGTDSTVRRLAGIGVRGWDYNRYGIVASVRCERGHARTAWECFRRDGPLAFLPLGDAETDGRFSIVWAVPHDAAVDLMACDDDAFIRMLNQAAGVDFRHATGGVRETTQRAAWPLELTVAGRLSAPRVVLAGNAAHTVHPVAGQGLNLGLRDVAALARVLDTPQGRKDPGQSIVLSAWADARRPDIAAVAAFTEGLAGIFGCRLPGARRWRDLGMRAMGRTAFLRDGLIRHAAGLHRAETA